MRIRPFHAERPPPDRAPQLASLPYDVVDTDQARRIGAENPSSFLHVIRPEIDLPGDTPPYDDAVYARGRRALDAFRTQGWLVRDPTDALYLYRLTAPEHQQTGVVAAAHIDDYEQGHIRRHEHTLPAKENDRTRHVDTLDANTGPVFLAYRDHAPVDRLAAETARQTPLYDFQSEDGVRHTVWQASATEPWLDAFREVPAAYVADGHHRAASAARVCALRRRQYGTEDPAAPYNWFLAVFFPASQLRILPYQRLVADLNGMSEAAFVDAVRLACDVVPAEGDGPRGPGEVHMLVGASRYALRWTAADGAGPVERLDVSILQDRVLGPILGIDHPRENPRIRFVGGVGGLEPLAAAVRSGAAAAAFALFPTSMDDLMAVADAGRVMPPKSTWFEPKLRSGLFVYPLSG